MFLRTSSKRPRCCRSSRSRIYPALLSQKMILSNVKFHPIPNAISLNLHLRSAANLLSINLIMDPYSMKPATPTRRKRLILVKNMFPQVFLLSFFLVHYSAPIFLLIFFHDNAWSCFTERSFLHLAI